MANDRISYWERRVSELSSEDTSAMTDDELVDHGMALEYAKEQLNFAWQDDELDSLGLPRPWGY